MDSEDRIGLVQVYTGNGKGKTTTALGLSMRAAGHGLKVRIIQFMKGQRTGEHLFIARCDNIEIRQLSDESYWTQSSEEQQCRADEALALARETLQQGKHDLVVLDEAVTALDRGLLSLAEVLSLLALRPPRVELVLTGRGAPRELIDAADLVTEMLEIKHPYQRGIPAREGIER